MIKRVLPFLVSCLVCAPKLAFAFTFMNLPGADCVVDTGGAANPHSYGWMTNTDAASDLYLICPVPLSDPASTPTGQAVFAVDQNFGDNVCCSSRRYNKGGGVAVSAEVCTSGTSASPQTITLTPPSFSGTWDARMFYCRVPETYAGTQSYIVSTETWW
jgi:hypothetical protein